MLEEFKFLGIGTIQPKLQNVAIGSGMSEVKEVLKSTLDQLTGIKIQGNCKRTSIGMFLYKGFPYITSSITVTLMAYIILKALYKKFNKKRNTEREEEMVTFPIVRS